MDDISLGLGIAALFAACIECFEYFKAASDIRRNYEVLLVKLEIQQERLLVWGDVVGIGSGELDSVEKDKTRPDLTKRCLSTIRSLLQDTEILKLRYGLCTVTSGDKAIHGTSVSANALKRFRIRFRQTPQGPGALDKTRWAIHDAAKFETLVTHLKDLIDGLIAKVPAPMERQDQKIKNDIASMVDNISGLKLVKEACEESYPSWHDAASAALDASEVDTVDGGLADERIAHYQSLVQGTPESMNANRGATTAFGPNKDVYLDVKAKIFFVLTEQCRKQGSGTPCDQMNLGGMSIRFIETNSFLAKGSLQTGSAPGYRIAKRIDAQVWSTADLSAYTEAQDMQRVRYLMDGEEGELPYLFNSYVVHVYVHCPPCACQIATALDICVYHQKSPFVEFHIRIDHHRPASCCPSTSNIDGLISIVQYLKEAERQDLGSRYAEMLKAFDREWLDHAIYHASEDEIVQRPSPEDQVSHIMGYYNSRKECQRTAAIVILGEADYCIRLMDASPFPPIESGRVPREDQIFMMYQRYIRPGEWRWQREYVGNYSPKAPIVSSRPPTSSSKDLEAEKSSAESRKRPRSSD